MQVAWSVTKLHSKSAKIEDPVIFERVDINEGNSWNSSSNIAVIPQGGWYYLHLDVASCSNSSIRLEVNVNDNPVFAAQFLAITSYAVQSRGQSAILKLSTGDTLKVSPPLKVKTICLHGKSFTAFYGMLLIPI